MNTFTQIPLPWSPQQILDMLVPIVDRAGEAIMNIYRQEDHGIQIKVDQSPLTQADLEANTILVEGLKEFWPSIPALSEEGSEIFAHGDEPTYYWAIDPLDGTKEFIKRNGEFTVNVALIFKGDPVLGVILAPALDQLYAGYCNANHAFNDNDASGNLSMTHEQKAMKRQGDKWIDIKVSRLQKQDPQRPVRIASSRSHPSPELATWLKQFNHYEVVEVGSSLKFCMLAEGLIDIYPRFGPTYIWDTAAGHAVVVGAGGKLSMFNEGQFKYSFRRILNTNFVSYGYC